eukprot:1117596_1
MLSVVFTFYIIRAITAVSGSDYSVTTANIIKDPFGNCQIPPEIGYTTIISPKNGACVTLSTKYPPGIRFLQDVLDTPRKWILGLRRSDDTEIAFNATSMVNFDAFASGQVLTLDLCRRTGGQIKRFGLLSGNSISAQAYLDGTSGSGWNAEIYNSVMHELEIYSDGEFATENVLMYFTDLDDVRGIGCP